MIGLCNGISKLEERKVGQEDATDKYTQKKFVQTETEVGEEIHRSSMFMAMH